MTEYPALECLHLTKSYGRVRAVEAVSLTLARGALLALLGPSGCGKTTVLRLIAGLETPDRGAIRLDGRTVSDEHTFIPAHRRRIGMVFQDYALFPHLTVEQNIAYGLSDPPNKRHRVREMLDLVGLPGLEKRMPHELSGGQQQRIALARALAPQPDLLLLDEPFSNLDVALRNQVREEVQRILQAAGVTAILVTHDQNEALSLADQVALMFDGGVVQCGSARALYETPVSRRAAQFLGEANVLPGDAHGDTAATALGNLPLRELHYGAVDVLLRPEHLSLSDTLPGAPAQVTRCLYYGTHQDVWVTWGEQPPLKVRCNAGWSAHSADTVFVQVTGPVLAYPTPTRPPDDPA